MSQQTLEFFLWMKSPQQDLKFYSLEYNHLSTTKKKCKDILNEPIKLSAKNQKKFKFDSQISKAIRCLGWNKVCKKKLRWNKGYAFFVPKLMVSASLGF